MKWTWRSCLPEVQKRIFGEESKRSRDQTDWLLLWQFETTTGFAAIDWTTGGLKVATIDGHAVTPSIEGMEADLQRIRSSFALMPKEKRDRGLNVLLVGQMSAIRGDAMLRAGAKSIDRTAAWHLAMPRFEGELNLHLFAGFGRHFEDAQEGKIRFRGNLKIRASLLIYH